MDRFDFSPLFRSTIGFDRLTRMLDAATRVDSASLGYPPYDIEKTGDGAYRLTMAVAGFSPDELDVTVQENVLLVTGKAQKEEENKNGGYLHRGIARRAFERRFSLADHMKVTSANIDNGMLHVDLVHEVPEAAKPRTIKIGTSVEPATGNGAEGRLIGSQLQWTKRPRIGGVLLSANSDLSSATLTAVPTWRVSDAALRGAPRRRACPRAGLHR